MLMHVVSAFHRRIVELDMPLARLALFLDPRHKLATMAPAVAGALILGSADPVKTLNQEARKIFKQLVRCSDA